MPVCSVKECQFLLIREGQGEKRKKRQRRKNKFKKPAFVTMHSPRNGDRASAACRIFFLSCPRPRIWDTEGFPINFSRPQNTGHPCSSIISVVCVERRETLRPNHIFNTPAHITNCRLEGCHIISGGRILLCSQQNRAVGTRNKGVTIP